MKKRRKKKGNTIKYSKLVILGSLFLFAVMIVRLSQLALFKEIDNIPKDIDCIARKTKLSVSEVNYKITLLQLEGKVLEKPGHKFVRIEEE